MRHTTAYTNRNAAAHAPAYVDTTANHSSDARTSDRSARDRNYRANSNHGGDADQRSDADFGGDDYAFGDGNADTRTRDLCPGAHGDSDRAQAARAHGKHRLPRE